MSWKTAERFVGSWNSGTEREEKIWEDGGPTVLSEMEQSSVQPVECLRPVTAGQ